MALCVVQAVEGQHNEARDKLEAVELSKTTATRKLNRVSSTLNNTIQVSAWPS